MEGAAVCTACAPRARAAGWQHRTLRSWPIASLSLARCPQVWGAWWALTTFARYLSCLERKQPFRTHGWQRLPVGPSRLRGAPLEPLVKLVLPLVGILGELWLGHDSYR